MATDPRQGFEPTDIISDVSAHFEALVALLKKHVEDLEAQPVPDGEALSRLRGALKAALRGAKLASKLDG
jgi:hypothetical protein